MRNRGFTLVEVIVVSVIVALLAATATLLYSGYVEQARKDTVVGLAKVAASSANAFWRRTGSAPTAVSQLNVFISDPSRFRVSVEGAEVTASLLNGEEVKFDTSFNYQELQE